MENDLHRLEALLGAVDELPAVQSVSTLVLPDELRGLDPFIKVWATSDDSDRSDAIANATDHELNTLWRSVAPHLKAIDALLDASRNDAATIEVGDLAQAALEARHELARRGKPA